MWICSHLCDPPSYCLTTDCVRSTSLNLMTTLTTPTPWSALRGCWCCMTMTLLVVRMRLSSQGCMCCTILGVLMHWCMPWTSYKHFGWYLTTLLFIKFNVAIKIVLKKSCSVVIIWNLDITYTCMVLTLPGRQEKTRNFKIKIKDMKKPGILLLFTNFHKKQCNNLEKSNICLKKKK